MQRRFVATALNDAVITAGPPFHMIELELGADGDEGVRYFGDGVIVSHRQRIDRLQRLGRRADHQPGRRGVLHHADLPAQPVVPPGGDLVAEHGDRARRCKVNEGTTLFCDGQAARKLMAGERVVIRRSPNDVLLVENPDTQWRSLAELNWAASPKYNGT